MKAASTSGPVNSPGELTRHEACSLSLKKTIQLAQQGDGEAFESIYHRHRLRVYALCMRMLHDRAEAEDVAQEVFIQLFRKIQTFRGESAFSTWLHRLTVNRILMHLRRKKPPSTSLDDSTGSGEEDIKPRQEIGGLDPRLSSLVDRLNLRSAIRQLPSGCREIFILYDVHGYRHSEIAKILGHSIGNSKSQLHKARRRLRELLQGSTEFSRAPISLRACTHSP